MKGRASVVTTVEFKFRFSQHIECRLRPSVVTTVEFK